MKADKVANSVEAANAEAEGESSADESETLFSSNRTPHLSGQPPPPPGNPPEVFPVTHDDIWLGSMYVREKGLFTKKVRNDDDAPYSTKHTSRKMRPHPAKFADFFLSPEPLSL